MKKLLLSSSLTALLTSLIVTGAKAQLTNPGFEQVNTSNISAYWSPFMVVSIPLDTTCTWTGADSASSLTTDAHTGNYAYQLGVFTYCEYVYSGNISARQFDTDTFADQRVPFHERPGSFTFYYKLTALHGDGAIAYIALDDEDGNMIGTGALSLTQNAAAWTLATIPIDYLGNDTPAFLSMRFWLGNDSILHYGTRFIIDDIDYSAPTSAGLLAAGENHRIACYPVPARNELFLDTRSIKGITDIAVYDAMGRQIKTLQTNITDSRLQLDVAGIQPGIYQIVLSTPAGRWSGRFNK